jgi:hypothetical protein
MLQYLNYEPLTLLSQMLMVPFDQVVIEHCHLIKKNNPGIYSL